PSALRWSGWAPNGSSMELDWSRRKTRAVGLARLIGAVYGTEGSFSAIPATREQPRYGLPVGHVSGGNRFSVSAAQGSRERIHFPFSIVVGPPLPWQGKSSTIIPAVTRGRRVA